MRVPRFLHVLIALAILAGQTLAVVHASGHELDRTAQHQVCESCALAHGGGLAHAAPALWLPHETAARTPEGRPSAPAARTLTTPPCRGPPFLTV